MGGLAKCLCYYISLCSKVAYGGGRGGVKNWQNLAYVVYGCPLRGIVKVDRLLRSDYLGNQKTRGRSIWLLILVVNDRSELLPIPILKGEKLSNRYRCLPILPSVVSVICIIKYRLDR